MKNFYVLFLLVFSLRGIAQNATADPAVGSINITDNGTYADRSDSITNSAVKLKVPLFNLNQSNSIPTGNTILRISLGSGLTLHSSTNLSTARLSNYFDFTYTTSETLNVITGTQKAPLPPNFNDSVIFQVFGRAAGISEVIAIFTINEGNLTDENLTNNRSTKTYNVTGPIDFRSAGDVVELQNPFNWEIYDGSSWIPADISPAGSNLQPGATVTVRPGHQWRNSGEVSINRGVTLVGQGTTSFSTLSGRKVLLNGTYVHNTTSSVANVLNGMLIFNGSTFIYRGSSTLTPPVSFADRNYSNLTFESTAGSYTTINATGSSRTVVSGTLTVGAGVTVQGTNFSGQVDFVGDIIVAGVLNFNSVTVFPDKTLNIMPGGTVRIPSGNKLTINGKVSGTGSVAGSVTSDLIIGGSGPLGTLYFDQTTDGTTNALDSLTVNRSSSGTVTIGNKLNILDVYTPKSGILSSNGNLVLKSTPIKTARVAAGPAEGGYVTGNVTVERYIPATGRKFRLLAPVTTGAQTINQAWQDTGKLSKDTGTWITSNVADAINKGFDAQSFNPSILVWDSTVSSKNSWYDRLVENTNAKALSSEPGYLLFIRGDRTVQGGGTPATSTLLKSTGNLVVGPHKRTVLGSTTSGAERYTLIGNPYASPIDFEQVYSNDQTTNIKPQFWIWDARRPGLGGYTLIRKEGGVYTAVPSPFEADADSTTTVLQHIQLGQAFFVEPASTAGGQVFIEENDKSGTVYNSVFRTTNTNAQKLRINLNQINDGITELTDGVMVTFNANYTSGIDVSDVVKLNSFNENLAIVRENKDLTIESRPLVTTIDSVFLSLTNTTQRNYQLAFKAENFNSNIAVSLEDKFLNTSTAISSNDITKVNFSITTDPASADSNRFTVVFKTNTTLPVRFTTIKAHRKERGIQVEWNVATETDINSYQVEKSNNGQQFSTVATVKSATNNSGTASYNWLDYGVDGTDNYYRIKGISNSGSSIYSGIVKVSSLKTKGGIVVYPNPIIGRTLSMQLNQQPAGKYNILLFNNNGQQVFNRIIEHQGGSTTQTIQLAGVTKGTYQLKISNGENTITQKIICN